MRYMDPGRPLDLLVAKKIFGWHLERRCWRTSDGAQMRPETWSPSTNDYDVQDLIKLVTPYVGKWESADGFFHIDYAEWADHGREDKETKKRWCDPDWKWYKDSEREDVDELPWSCHFHPGLIGADAGTPKHWAHGGAYCARGRTMAHAVCLASMKALEELKKPLPQYDLEAVQARMKARVGKHMSIRKLSDK